MNYETEEQRLIREWLERNEVNKVARAPVVKGGKPARAFGGLVSGSIAVARSFAAGRGSLS